MGKEETPIDDCICFNKKYLGPYVYAILVSTDSGYYFVEPEDEVVGWNLRMAGDNASDEIEKIKSYISKSSEVLIVGAHIGSIAVPAAKFCKQLHAIEANPRTYHLLEMNMAINQVSNAKTYNLAASNKSEKLKFLINKKNSGGSKREPQIKAEMYYEDNTEEISVKAMRLDRMLKDHSFDVVLMDIEGSEYFALKGMQKILAKCKTLIIEFLPHHLCNVSNVTVSEFISLITPHFSKLTIPTKNIVCAKNEFESHLTEMYKNDQGDDGLIFEK